MLETGSNLFFSLGMQIPKNGGGWHSIGYTIHKVREAHGTRRLWNALRSRNTCKTCALGMGGQRGGMVNEIGHFPEVCKKSIQAMVADMQPAIPSEFWSEWPVARLKRLSPRELEMCGRLSEPVRYSERTGRYEPISWEAALNAIAVKLRRLDPDESFWYFSGRSSNEAGFLLQLFARLYGTNNVNNCSYYCHQASGVGLSSSIGSGTATITLEDLNKTDLIFVIGANPASNHPRLMRSLMTIRRRGGKVIVINPIREVGLESFRIPSDARSLLLRSDIATDYIQPHIGGDLALLTGLAKRVVELGGHDVDFLSDHCNGSTDYLSHLQGQDWKTIADRAGVSREQIDRVARTYVESEHVVFSWAMGITHHMHGTENVQSIANLALLRGMVGKPGAGLMPIRGHSNVQGMGSVGVTPRLKDAIFHGLSTRFGLTLPTGNGLDTMACMEAASEGRLKFGFCLGGNLYGSNPDSTFAARALSTLDQLVFLSTTLNTGHTTGLPDGTIILPVKARDEENQSTTQESMFNYVRLSDGGPSRIDGTRSEIDIIADLARRVLGTIALEPKEESADHADGILPTWEVLGTTRGIRQMIAQVVPGYRKIAAIGETGEEFQIDGRTFHHPQFNTPDGRARLQTHDLAVTEKPDATSRQPTFRLMTIRSEGQFNTVVYEEEDVYRGIKSRDVVLAHSKDLSRLSLTSGDRCTISGPGGSMTGIRICSFDRIRPGNVAMYFPEANVLLDHRVDPMSRTPAFRGVRVRLASE